MCSITHKIHHFIEKLETYGWPVLLLAMRLWIGHLFWRSGLIKVHHWSATLDLFKFEYKVPYAPDSAAYLCTAFELICPVLLVLGLLTRLATLPLLAITAMIHFIYLHHVEHLYWAFLLATLLVKGPGPLSIDALWCKRYTH